MASSVLGNTPPSRPLSLNSWDELRHCRTRWEGTKSDSIISDMRKEFEFLSEAFHHLRFLRGGIRQPSDYYQSRELQYITLQRKAVIIAAGKIFKCAETKSSSVHESHYAQLKQDYHSVFFPSLSLLTQELDRIQTHFRETYARKTELSHSELVQMMVKALSDVEQLSWKIDPEKIDLKDLNEKVSDFQKWVSKCAFKDLDYPSLVSIKRQLAQVGVTFQIELGCFFYVRCDGSYRSMLEVLNFIQRKLSEPASRSPDDKIVLSMKKELERLRIMIKHLKDLKRQLNIIPHQNHALELEEKIDNLRKEAVNSGRKILSCAAEHPKVEQEGSTLLKEEYQHVFLFTYDSLIKKFEELLAPYKLESPLYEIDQPTKIKRTLRALQSLRWKIDTLSEKDPLSIAALKKKILGGEALVWNFALKNLEYTCRIVLQKHLREIGIDVTSISTK